MTAKTEPTPANIHVALAAAQAEMGKVTKGSTNPHFKNKYADLADLVSVARPALNAHGIAYWHEMGRDESGGLAMATVLCHGASGTMIRCDVPLIVQKNDMQGMKSATTYAKRIGFESVTGIAPEDDDDGNAAAAAAPKPSAIVTEQQFLTLRNLLDEVGANEDVFLRYYGAKTLGTFPADKFAHAKEKLEAKRQPEPEKETEDATA